MRSTGLVRFVFPALFCLLAGLCCLAYPWRLAFTASPVINTSDRRQFEARCLPGFIHQRPDSRELLAFRAKISRAIPLNASEMDRAIALRKWCRAQHTGSWGNDAVDTEDPQVLLDAQRRGLDAQCRTYAYVFLGVLLAAGFDARVVSAAGGVYDSDESHTLVEVWICDLKKWVLMDSMFNTIFLVHGQPASLMEVRDALIGGVVPGRVVLERNGAATEPVPVLDASFAAMFQQLYYSTTNAVFDGYRVRLFGPKRISFLHYAPAGEEPYPQAWKQALLVSGVAFSMPVFVLVVRAAACLRVRTPARRRRPRRALAEAARQPGLDNRTPLA